jgi:hypothetical protein
MANTVTLAQLRTTVARLGQYEGSTDITATVLNEYINEAIAELYDLLIGKWQDYYVKSGTVTTVAGTQSYSLPSDFYKLRKLELALTTGSNARMARLHPVDLDDQHRYVTIAGPIKYRYRVTMSPSTLWLVPTPTSVDTLTVYYIPFAPTLSSDSETFETINRYDKLVVQLALRACKVREDLPHEDIDAEIARLTSRIAAAADGLDAHEPFYLGDYGGDDGPIGGGGGPGFGGWW